MLYCRQTNPDLITCTKFKPAPYNEKSVNGMLDQVISWGSVLKDDFESVDGYYWG